MKKQLICLAIAIQAAIALPAAADCLGPNNETFREGSIMRRLGYQNPPPGNVFVCQRGRWTHVARTIRIMRARFQERKFWNNRGIDITQTIGGACNDQSSCTFACSVAAFGTDPTPADKKECTVQLFCTPIASDEPNTPMTYTVRDGETGSLRCS
jgi:hypothetical protein